MNEDFAFGAAMFFIIAVLMIIVSLTA